MDEEAIAASANNEENKQMELHGTAPATSKADGAGDEQACSSNAQLTPKEVAAINEKRENVLKELIATEHMYVLDLQIIVEGYIRHFLDCPNDPPQPEVLNDRRFMIFGNIDVIYEWHKNKFLADLQKCEEKPELLGPLFRRFLDRKMCLYETYCRNQPLSEYIVSEYDSFFQEIRNRLGQKKLPLADLLIKPIKRVEKYHQLVKEILTYSEQAQCPAHVIASLHDAMTSTDIISNNAISMMDVGNLHGFTGNITAQGKLILQDTVNVTDLIEQSEEREMSLFLFEQCLIFTDPLGKKGTSATFNYVSHIEVVLPQRSRRVEGEDFETMLKNKVFVFKKMFTKFDDKLPKFVIGMDLEEVPDTLAFLLKSVEHNQRNRQSYFCRPKTEEKHRKWLNAINDIIETQINYKYFGNLGAYMRELRNQQQQDDPDYSDSDQENESKKNEEEEIEISLESCYYSFLLTYVFYSRKHNNIPDDLRKRARKEFNLEDEEIDEDGYWIE